MNVPTWVWLLTIAITIAFFVFEFFAHVRKPHEPTIRESAIWSVFYISLALLFGVGIGVVNGWTFGGEYFAGYLTEKALSVDNLFVFLLLMTSFAVPKAYQQKVLMIGIIIALVMRGAFIAVGAALINNFAWVFYLFAILLFVLAFQQLRGSHGGDAQDNPVVRFAKRVLPTTDDYDGQKIFTKIDGKRFVTPLFIVIIAIGVIDLVFAIDSIPAIYGLTNEAYIVFTANAFALMGLRQLYFLIGGLLERLVYLSQGLAVILGFIGVKLLLHALHENNLPFLNGGEPFAVPEISTGVSLGVIGGVIVIATVASLLKTRGQMPPSDQVPGQDAPVVDAAEKAAAEDLGRPERRAERGVDRH